MSAPTEGASNAGEGVPDRRQSIGKYVKRLRTVLKRDRSSKSSLPKVEPSQPKAEPKAAPAAAAASSSAAPAPTATTTTTTTTEPAPAAAPVESKPVTSTSGLSAYHRSAAQQERARALFAKYGLTLEAHEWITTGTPDAKVERVEKPIRMRVHRQCHRCQTTFGPDRVCAKCEHKRCKKCPRYPAKKDKGKGKEAEKEKGVVGVAGIPDVEEKGPVTETERIGTTAAAKPGNKTYLTIKPRTGGPELERRPPKQRVRRTCHHCAALFVPATASVCAACQHSRCTKCPREPSKRRKWPDGYPGDVQASDGTDDEGALRDDGGEGLGKPERVWRKPRQRVRWNCEQCGGLFMEKSKVCGGCGHERCKECKRAPPKKAKKEPDADLVKAVEEKLAKFRIEAEAEAASPAAADVVAPAPVSAAAV